MALPRRKGYALALLGRLTADGVLPPGSQPRGDYGAYDYQSISTPRPDGQKSFYSYGSYFLDYPPEIAIKVRPSPSDGCFGYFNYIFLSGEQTWTYTYPEPIVTEYDSRYEDPPNPNGGTGVTTQDYPLTQFESLYPRWVADTPAYNFSASGVAYNHWSSVNPFVVPKINYDYGLIGTSSYPPLTSSWFFSVENYESKVYNSNTEDYEYYPFTQDTVEYKGQGYIGFQNNSWPNQCFNEGTVISGKVSIYSIDVTVTAKDDPATPGFGFGGISAVTGNTFTFHSELDWTLTIEDGFTPPPLVDIPQVENKITFINDFWITSVTPPA